MTNASAASILPRAAHRMAVRVCYHHPMILAFHQVSDFYERVALFEIQGTYDLGEIAKKLDWQHGTELLESAVRRLRERPAGYFDEDALLIDIATGQYDRANGLAAAGVPTFPRGANGWPTVFAQPASS